MMDIKYVNSRGDTLDLLEPPYLLQTGEFFDYEWTFDTASSSGKIAGFYKEICTKSMTLSITNYGKENYCHAVNRFFEVTEYDVLNQKPGRLYVGSQYVECYITASVKTEWESDSCMIDNELTITIEHPFWTTETMQEFHVSAVTAGSTKKYPCKYPLRYIGGNGIGYLINDSHADSNFVLRIFGPVSSPAIVIGGYAYCIYDNLEDGEYLKADSRNGTIVKVARSGAETNAFGKKQNRTKFFKKIPPGSLPVEWSGNFSFDVTVFDERSEPRWE